MTIVLGADDSIYVAKIGETQFASIATALSVANASSDDVVVELLSDVSLKTFTIKNNYGKNITINGNGHTLTIEGGNNAFVINQEDGAVAFENMTLKHKNTGAAIQISALATVNLTDVVLDATGGNAYNYNSMFDVGMPSMDVGSKFIIGGAYDSKTGMLEINSDTMFYITDDRYVLSVKSEESKNRHTGSTVDDMIDYIRRVK